jgi:hypothetical protein
MFWESKLYGGYWAEPKCGSSKKQTIVKILEEKRYNSKK